MNQKTIIIYDQCGLMPVEFYVLDGDYRHLNGIYGNHSKQSKKLTDELCDLFYDEEGESLLTPVETFPVDEVKNGAFVIVAGFLP
ncbi:hypothetical protein [Acinetobacter sp.]|uniref:hypothetical protein n=1 Tax=Acinetobacter sp. TaxID=472 RepID=UPI00388FCE77